jgi:hypothetical protein
MKFIWYDTTTHFAMYNYCIIVLSNLFCAVLLCGCDELIFDTRHDLQKVWIVSRNYGHDSPRRYADRSWPVPSCVGDGASASKSVTATRRILVTIVGPFAASWYMSFTWPRNRWDAQHV